MLLSDNELCRQRSSGIAGVVTLTKVKHRRELLFAALPLLFAIHQFIEGFVWLGLDGTLSPAVAHDMGAAFMLYAQGLLPFLAPLSILLFEPNKKSRRRMLPFVVLGAATTLYILWGLTAFPLQVYVQHNSIVYINQATNNTVVALLYLIVTCGALFFSDGARRGHKVFAVVPTGLGSEIERGQSRIAGESCRVSLPSFLSFAKSVE